MTPPRGGLTLTALTKRYGSVTAVDAVSLDIQSGEFLTLLGPSGSGKSTLLMMIAGFAEVTSGDLALDGVSIKTLAPERRNFGMVFQGYALFPHMTVAQNIAYPLDVRKRPRAEIAARVAEMLELVQLTGFGTRLPGQLSGGQQQRVALARALAFAPAVLLLDEPLGALDKKLRVEVQAQLKAIHTQIGTTFVYVTHDQEEALSMSDRIAILNHGRIEQLGTPSGLYERPRTAFAASFLGRANFLTQGATRLALRPEKIDLRPQGQAPGRLTGTISKVTYFGATIAYDVAIPGQPDMAVDVAAWRGGPALPPGTPVDLDWPDQAAVPLDPA